MEQSILKSTKKILNVGEDDPAFDQDIITHINSAFSHLHQLGIGPHAGLVIEDDTSEWADLLIMSDPMLSQVKTYIYLKVKSFFDPPQLPHVMNAMNEQIREHEVRLSILRETAEWVDPDPPLGELDDAFDGVIQVVDGGDAG